MKINHLTTEKRNPNTLDIDECSSLEVVRKINNEDQTVPAAIEKVLPEIASVVDQVVAAFRNGGRLIYTGAGTSGRLGILDASECPPTYGTPSEMVIGIIAGGGQAIHTAVEGAEDDKEAGMNDLKNLDLTKDDVVVAIAASGRTPYAIGALEYANEIGAVSAALVCSSDSEMSKVAQHTIAAVVGPEVVTGSTRMKAGTAQKLVLNMISTASMIGIGKVYSNLMVDVQPSNKKLVQRAKNIVVEATGCSPEEAEQALSDHDGYAKGAILQLLTELSPSETKTLLEKKNGMLKQALKEFKG
ncbi:N-acetylmuramic acid 6-phosphate etherase [Fictibacillus sp. KU28468]|uniref:N-acetylmuramic acid 6-phosphate etherase n=1 Tax=Fictibacillus sp. KU28468 TaxID=2991053 RepID=UPI00223D0A26|nr:N-acetylmuramic acid 6-phosphate etherase [Fictibacillus sp. KU28468]UZJ80189.1 N-acetylmuramic acid 6-phosphate etherase [Fictibacillus sp. KU28468]